MVNKDNSPSYSRYSFGSTVLKHKDKYVTTSLGSVEYEIFLRTLTLKNSRLGTVPHMVEARPDLISNIFYDTPGYWWYVMQYNGITDPFEQLKSGDTLNIPEL